MKDILDDPIFIAVRDRAARGSMMRGMEIYSNQARYIMIGMAATDVMGVFNCGRGIVTGRDLNTQYAAPIRRDALHYLTDLGYIKLTTWHGTVAYTRVKEKGNEQNQTQA